MSVGSHDGDERKAESCSRHRKNGERRDGQRWITLTTHQIPHTHQPWSPAWFSSSYAPSKKVRRGGKGGDDLVVIVRPKSAGNSERRLLEVVGPGCLPKWKRVGMPKLLVFGNGMCSTPQPLHDCLDVRDCL